MMKAPAPMMGGMSCPPVEAAASTPPANFGENPTFFIMGIVMDPVPTVLATALPEIDPMRPLPNTAIFAGPPTDRPMAAIARLMMNSPAPDLSRKAANKTKRKTNVEEMVAIVPKMPSGAKYMR
jgi:hypothetical protein